MTALTGVVFSPLVPWAVFWPLALLAGCCATLGLALRARGAVLRSAALAGLMLLIAGPQWVTETREPIDDVAVILVDATPSQALTGRLDRVEEAAATLSERLSGLDGLETRVVRLENGGVEGTRMADALGAAFADVPPERRAGAILITDGQVHDTTDIRPVGAPVHVLLTGSRTDHDRLIILEDAPRFGMVGSTVDLRITVEDDRLPEGTPVPVTLFRAGRADQTRSVPANRETVLPVSIDSPGANVIGLSVPETETEISGVNNRIAVTINGVRDRLKVLLVSGRPHVGERVWRNSLKADPAVDLIHFTILRSPLSEDPTPTDELSLIAFPIHELFEEKLGSFDLIIFDRFVRWGLVPEHYLRNVSQAVRDGGAVLFSIGPEFTRPGSLADSPLSEILPALATGRVLDDVFVPRLTPDGRRHPVTAALPDAFATTTGARPGADTAANAETPAWGPWIRQVELVGPQGRVLMDGAGGLPLLIASKEGEGRTVLLASDTLWLWAKGWQGGGPQGELLKRLVHWAMKEPDLDDEALIAEVRNGTLHVTSRTVGEPVAEVRVFPPDGSEKHLALLPVGPGVAEGGFPARLPGLYRISTEKGAETFAVVGGPNPLETTRLLPTESLLGPVVRDHGGAVIRLEDHGVPEVRRRSAGQSQASDTWIGLRVNEAHLVSGVASTPAIPVWLGLIFLAAFVTAAWWWEGRSGPLTWKNRKIFMTRG